MSEGQDLDLFERRRAADLRLSALDMAVKTSPSSTVEGADALIARAQKFADFLEGKNNG